MVSAEVKDGKLIVTADLGIPAPSKSGKTLIIASTHGPLHTAAVVEGKPLTVNLNAYVAK